MIGDGSDDPYWQRYSSEGLEDVPFVQQRTVEHSGKAFGTAIGQQSSHDSGRTPAGQCHFLRGRQLRQFCQHQFLGQMPQCGISRRRKAEGHKIMGIEFAHQSQTEGLGDIVMKCKRTLYAVTGRQLLVAGDFLQQESRQIRSSEEQAKMQFFEMRVLQQTTKDFFAMLVNQCGKLFHRRIARLLRGDSGFLVHVARLQVATLLSSQSRRTLQS